MEPVIVLAFANDRDEYLDMITRERENRICEQKRNKMANKSWKKR
jgi:hypothetical protein